MEEPLAFVLAALALLATPGPTNTLLATSGAAAGFQRSLHLIVAEITGYMISISVLALVIGPLVRASHALDVGLRVACGVYLLYTAWRLWREGAVALSSSEPVQFWRVLVATLLNPKGIVFAFVIVPHFAEGAPALAAPYMAGLAGLIAAAGGGWIGLGAAVRSGAALQGGLARRAGALVLGVFALLISGSALGV